MARAIFGNFLPAQNYCKFFSGFVLGFSQARGGVSPLFWLNALRRPEFARNLSDLPCGFRHSFQLADGLAERTVEVQDEFSTRRVSLDENIGKPRLASETTLILRMITVQTLGFWTHDFEKP
jgi:hypothetical protein